MSEGRAFAEELFSVVDTRQGAAFARYFAPEGAFAFGNAPPIVGHEAIAAGCDWFFGHISGMRHAVEDVWEANGSVIARLLVSYTRNDGLQLTLPCVSILRRGDSGAITDYRVYMDVNPVLA